jgi:chloramphenicol-sensitive protein RarD
MATASRSETAVPQSQDDAGGIALGIAAYAIWGLLPLYIHLLVGVPALQVLAHRVLWSLVLLVILVVALKRVGSIASAARGKTLALLLLSTALIATNWFVYIWAVQHGHVVDASLGYFVNPLLNVVIGIALLGERLRRWQGVAIGVAAVGVLLLALRGGALWIPLLIALSFAFYAFVRKVAAIDPLGGLVVETLILAPFSLWWLIHAAQAGQGAFGHDLRLDLLLIFAGVVTAAPLLMFTAAARRMRFATLGLVQYVTPTAQFLCGVLLLGEHVAPAQLASFALIWTGCALYAWDSIRSARQG